MNCECFVPDQNKAVKRNAPTSTDVNINVKDYLSFNLTDLKIALRVHVHVPIALHYESFHRKICNKVLSLKNVDIKFPED